MGVRPPSNDVGDEPETIEFGIAELDARFDEDEVSFPVTDEDLASSHGDLRISVDAAGHEMRLADAVAESDHSTFDSKQDLLNALHPVFEAERERRAGSIVGRLRSLFSF